ncbi:DEAD/DEAH box helicase [Alicyclobacillus ferrooxydans]|uniref:DEAD/DEAH box helicase n=1 Tax=Alicyclobacillus ferrooxydans TaxID=471514 RepID=UPI0009FB5016|nr:SNF2-related protein [Alicyclobacillus ferrooxydans]
MSPYHQTNLSQIAHTNPLVPPVVWPDEDIKTAFTAYLENVPVGNSQNRDWELFQLGRIAAQARLVEDFEELYALQHIRGFTPLPHQVDTARQVLQSLHGRAILADEVGLGKTIEAGLIAKEYLVRGLAKKILIMAPASLVLQWTREFNEKFGIRAVAQKKAWMWTQYDVLVASLDTAKREPHRSIVLGMDWDLVIVDEAHKLKNPRTRNWQMVNQIPNKYMLLLTATPIQNQLTELHTLITLLRPGQLGSTAQFVVEHMASKREAKDPEALRSRLSEVMIRNQRNDGATTLPPRHVQAVSLSLNDQERTLYNGVVQFLRDSYEEQKGNRISVLPLITLQREICSSPHAAMTTLLKMRKKAQSPRKIEQIDELLALCQNVEHHTKIETVLQLIEQLGGKCIIFTEYRATQDFLMSMLYQHKIPAVPFRGGFKRSKKDWMTELFQRRAQVLVATESGGEGINLQFCHQMINYDLPWNPMRLEQRIGRIHRLGQEHPVAVFNLATRDTIEGHIVTLLQEKIRMFEHVIGALDYIVGDPAFGEKMERELLDIALTTNSDRDLERRIADYGERLLERLNSGGTPS